MTGRGLIEEALLLLGVIDAGQSITGTNFATLALCQNELNTMLARWNDEGPAHFESVYDLRRPLSFSSGHVQAIVYNLAIALESQFCSIRNQGLHRAATDAWLCLVRSEESGLIDCTPGSFRRAAQYMPDGLERELLAILSAARAELAERLEALRAAA